MDPRLQDALVQRLISNPHDQAAIAEAHSAGQQHPEGYAELLERVGTGTPEPTLAAHWLNEAASVWLTTFNDVGRAVEVLLMAVDRDPEGEGPYTRLQDLYRQQGDTKGLLTAAERRAHALAKRALVEPSVKPLALEALRDTAQRLESTDAKAARRLQAKAIELAPDDALAIYTLREAHKAALEFAEALPLFALELAIEADPERRKALIFDEAEVAKRAGQAEHGYLALVRLMTEHPEDVVLKAHVGSYALEAYRAGLVLSPQSKEGAGRTFVELAEMYPGEHGLAYSMCALELLPADDRAVQLAMYYAEQLQRLPEVASLAAGYVAANPNGVMVAQARQVAGNARPPAAPGLSAPGGAPSGGAPSTGTPVDGAHAGATGLESIDDLLERADSLAKKSRKNEAIATYRQVLERDPVNADALVYLCDQLPLKRRYVELRDVLMQAALAGNAGYEDQVKWLREAADVSENQLRDVDSAVNAWQRITQLQPENHAAFDQLRRLLERGKRWDELAAVLTQEAANTEDVEAKIAIERSLAKLHEESRKDLVAAGEAWARIAGLSPGDEDALREAVRLFESAERPDRAADTIAAFVGQLDDEAAKRALYVKLGDLRATQGQPREGGEALAEGAAALSDAQLWARAEHYFVHAQAWEQAANSADEQEKLAETELERAALLSRSARYLLQIDGQAEALPRLERAVELAPMVEEYSSLLEQQLIAANRVSELAGLFLARAERISDVEARVTLRKRAAKIQREHLNDVTAARTSYIMVLRDAQDPETLLWLANDAEQRTDLDASAAYLARLVDAEPDTALKVEYCLREARMRARGAHDVDAGLERLTFILDELDANNEIAMNEIADLQQARGRHEEAAKILDRLFKATKSDEAKLEVAVRLGELYERRLNKPEDAIRTLSYVHEADPGDFDATQRLCRLAEESSNWDLVAELMQELIAVEGDAEEVSRMTQRLAQVYADNLGKGDEGLRVLAEAGAKGDEACREAFIELGDRLDKPDEVGRHLVAWFKDAKPSPARAEALNAAFARFVKSDNDAEAIAVAMELGKSGVADAHVGEILEPIAVRARNLPALRIAHGLRALDLAGEARAEELVRQAEVLVGLDVDPLEAIAHGESGLANVEPAAIEPLLARLAALTSDKSHKIDVYDRQILRFEQPDDRLNALCRAAEVAVELEDTARAAAFFQLALDENLPDEAIERIVEVVREMDKRRKADGAGSLRLVLAESLAVGGQSARDGGKTRSRMLRRAAKLAQFELDDSTQALAWIGQALGQYVDAESLATLDEIAAAVGDYAVAESVATKALEEVFDGPMVRELLKYRADLRQDRLDNLAGAAEDLRRLHDLQPSDFEVSSRLATMYEELGDYLGMVRLHEDQIIRSRDQALRGELARVVARLWRDKLNDPRETADAWRRVLRLHSGDEEAKEGLAKAKASMLQSRAPDSEVLPPPVLGTAPMPETPPPSVLPPPPAETEDVPSSAASKGDGLAASEAEQTSLEGKSAASDTAVEAATSGANDVNGEEATGDDESLAHAATVVALEVAEPRGASETKGSGADDASEARGEPDVDGAPEVNDGVPPGFTFDSLDESAAGDERDSLTARSPDVEPVPNSEPVRDQGNERNEVTEAAGADEADAEALDAEIDDAEVIEVEEDEAEVGDDDGLAAARPAPPPSRRSSVPDRESPKPPPPPSLAPPRK